MALTWGFAVGAVFLPATLLFLVFFIFYKDKTIVYYVDCTLFVLYILIFGLYFTQSGRYIKLVNSLQSMWHNTTVFVHKLGKRKIIIPRKVNFAWYVAKPSIKMAFFFISTLIIFTHLYEDLKNNQTREFHSVLLYLIAASYVVMMVYVNIAQDIGLQVWLPTGLMAAFTFLYYMFVDNQGSTAWIVMCMEMISCVVAILWDIISRFCVEENFPVEDSGSDI